MSEEDGQTNLKIDIHYQKDGFFDKVKSFLLKPLIKRQFTKSLQDIKTFAEKVHSGKISFNW